VSEMGVLQTVLAALMLDTGNALGLADVTPRQLGLLKSTSTRSVGTDAGSWRDDFEGTTLDRSSWNVEVNCNGGGNGEAQCYVDSAENLYVANGKLHIVATRAASGQISSARLTTQGKFEVAYGIWEARLRIPGVKGTWPAFWTLGADIGQIGWPACGEIDIMENFQRGGENDNTLYSTAHSLKHSWGTNTALPGGSSPTLDLSMFHTVRLEWAPDSLSFFVNGVQTWRLNRPNGATNYDWPYAKPHFALLNLAIGGNGVGFAMPPVDAYPIRYEIDYVSITPLPPLPPHLPPLPPVPPKPPSLPWPIRCGVATCDALVWATMAGGYACGARIEWLQGTEPGSPQHDEYTACKQVAVDEYPIACGGCDPRLLVQLHPPSPKVAPPPLSPKAPSPSPTPQCGVPTCTASVWSTDAEGFTCGDRIIWVMGQPGATESSACEQVGRVEFPNECGGCDPTQGAGPPPSPSPPPPPCGVSTCTTSVWATLAEGFTCGDRIVWVQNNLGETETIACERVARVEFPNECGGCDPTQIISAPRPLPPSPSVPSPSPSPFGPPPSSPPPPLPSPSPFGPPPSSPPPPLPAPPSSPQPQTPPSTPAPSPPPLPSAPFPVPAAPQQPTRCGMSTCNSSVWATFADGFTCGDRILWVMGQPGATESSACEQVGRVEYPDQCGGCDPTQDNALSPSPSPPPPPCGVSTCTSTVWATLAGGFTCGDRIAWVINTHGESEATACERVGRIEFPNECGGCDPMHGAQHHGSPSPPPSAPAPPPPCGVSSCTDSVWATLANGFTCGDRITWLQDVEKLDEDQACRQVASKEFPDQCGSCDPRPTQRSSSASGGGSGSGCA